MSPLSVGDFWKFDPNSNISDSLRYRSIVSGNIPLTYIGIIIAVAREKVTRAVPTRHSFLLTKLSTKLQILFALKCEEKLENLFWRTLASEIWGTLGAWFGGTEVYIRKFTEYAILPDLPFVRNESIPLLISLSRKDWALVSSLLNRCWTRLLNDRLGHSSYICHPSRHFIDGFASVKVRKTLWGQVGNTVE